MARNTETLSTRDLASPNESAGDVASSQDDRRPVAAGEDQAGVDDQAVAEGTRVPVEDLGADSVASGRAAEDRPADSTDIVSAPERDAEAARASTGEASNGGGSLLSADMDATFQARWKEIQTRFVDEPRGAVEDADGLVANLMQQLAEGFAKERERLEAQWGRGEDISTEDLRVALQRYRTFFQRLLST
jgi:hypothetical protein